MTQQNSLLERTQKTYTHINVQNVLGFQLLGLIGSMSVSLGHFLEALGILNCSGYDKPPLAKLLLGDSCKIQKTGLVVCMWQTGEDLR